MTKGFVTNHEIRQMQERRDAGALVSQIAAEFGRSRNVVSRYTKPRQGPTPSARNERLLKLAKGRTGELREALARRYGFASAKSMNTTLCVYRQRMRQAEGASA